MEKIGEEAIQEIKEKIVNHFQPDKIILFGSYACGSAKKGSDLDLLIVKKSDGPRHKRSIPIRRLFRGYMIPMDILVYTPCELKRYRNIKGSFAHKVLSKGRILHG
ncbi:nucleotidyltransferase domain-containing protein [bacterium]|nr:nucleotidyltransferase domain-containing protein [bacterium]